MKNIHYLDLDGHQLRLLLTVYEDGSVTRAAARLGMTQSAVSHSLERLRSALGDRLFVRAGRGIAATPRAVQLMPDVRAALQALQALTDKAPFDPARAAGEWRFAASDYQRELLLPQTLARMRAQAPDLDVRVIHSGGDEIALLRQARCDLLLTPYPPDATDVLQRRLFQDHWMCFYDPSVIPPPRTRRAYLSRPHAKVVFTDDEAGPLDTVLLRDGVTRRVALKVPSFSALPSLMAGTDLIAVLPAKAGAIMMSDFAACRCPIDFPPLSFYMVWHQRNQDAPLHTWVRDLLADVSGALASRRKPR